MALQELTITQRLKLNTASLNDIAEAILAIVQFAVDHRGALVELDVNPLILCANVDSDVLPIDALIRLELKAI
jgi:succinyl-CoA synthetase beta subunit